jgi:hypothetical protein
MKKLIAMVSTKGKTPDEVAAELVATIGRYQEASAASAGDPEDATSSADQEAAEGSE